MLDSSDKLLEMLRHANRLLAEVRQMESAITETDGEDMDGILALCDDTASDITWLRRSVEHRRDHRQATVNEMARSIAWALGSHGEKKDMRKKTSLAGGIMQAVRRNAGGKCECCGSDDRLTHHHIIPRSEGGSDDIENMALLCAPCHDEIEGDANCRTREAIRLHIPSRRIDIRPVADKTPVQVASEAALREEAKRIKIIEQRERDAEVAMWASQWCAYDLEVIRLGDPEPKRPLKPWHVWVYGAGRHSEIARGH